MEHSVFEFSSGLCHVMTDKIVFNQSTNPEERYGLPSIKPSDLITPKLIPAVFFLALVLSIVLGDPFDNLSPLVLMVLAMFVFFWFYDHGASQTQMIPMENLLYVKYKTIKLGEPQGYFVFHFKDGDGKKRRRVIKMKPFTEGGKESIETAKSLFTTRGIFQS
ncbi:hypothetical protein [Gilvibacter sp.]|uniref:hypothetical protein n=1 Tax=Gilvibacter sp. TaxID=2729997 RepID=UPI003F4A3E8B